MDSLACKAVSQNRPDILPRLIAAVDSGPHYLSRFLRILMHARKFDEANALYADMCSRAAELPERVQADLPWLKRNLFEYPTLYAIEDSDYEGARHYLEALGRHIPVLAAAKDGLRSDGRAFERAGSMIVQKIAKSEQS